MIGKLFLFIYQSLFAIDINVYDNHTHTHTHTITIAVYTYSETHLTHKSSSALSYSLFSGWRGKEPYMLS